MEALMRVCEAVADVATLEVVGRMLGTDDCTAIMAVIDSGEMERRLMALQGMELRRIVYDELDES